MFHSNKQFIGHWIAYAITVIEVQVAMLGLAAVVILYYHKRNKWTDKRLDLVRITGVSCALCWLVGFHHAWPLPILANAVWWPLALLWWRFYWRARTPVVTIRTEDPIEEGASWVFLSMVGGIMVILAIEYGINGAAFRNPYSMAGRTDAYTTHDVLQWHPQNPAGTDSILIWEDAQITDGRVVLNHRKRCRHWPR